MGFKEPRKITKPLAPRICPPTKCLAAVMLSASLWSASGQSCGQQPPDILAGPITNSANQHLYYLLQPGCWTDAEAMAVSMGGHLVTINDQDEYYWLMNQFLTSAG